MSFLSLAAFPLSVLLAVVLVPLAVKLAWITAYLDHPEARKLHTSATALLGGAAVFVSALVVWGSLLPWIRHGQPDAEAWSLAAGAAIALGIGLWDDRFGMRPSVKLIGQAASAAILISAAGIPDSRLPAPIAGVIALVMLIGLMNAVNFLDNMNGMVGGLAPIALVGFAWTSLARGATGLGTAQLALAGACVGFLPSNFPRARIFLGDAGSLLLGYSLGASALLAMRAAPAGWGRIGPAIILGYPVFDLIFVVITRVRDGRPIYQGGKDHSNHRLASLVGRQEPTVGLLWLVGAALCVSGIAVMHLDHAAPALALAGAWCLAMLASGWRLAAVPFAHRD